MEGWQFGCCGVPFRVGGEIDWRLSPPNNRDYLATLLGKDAAAALTDVYDHHYMDGTAPDEDDPDTRGKVISIGAAYCNYAPPSGEPGPAIAPVAGTGVIEPRSAADREEPDRGRQLFCGFVVEIDALE